MALSVFDLFKIGIGPSSSHTVGPMIAADRFARGLAEEGTLATVRRVGVELFGSLGATGKGHGSIPAVALGLMGERPDVVDPALTPDRIAVITQSGQLSLLAGHPIAFSLADDIVLHRNKQARFHSNAMIFRAYDGSDTVLAERTFYSIGGGFVIDDSQVSDDDQPVIVADETPVRYPFSTGDELLTHAAETGLRISDMIIPAVLQYFHDFVAGADDDCTVRFLLVAAGIGSIIKENASISGAEVGCQGEVGSACSMAAAGLAELLGGTALQVENAAEIGIEHNLGLTCDPVGGLVQIPCIERNAVGAVKAINAARISLSGDGTHQVSLDKAVKTMRETGADMKDKYKETARGGLALNVVEC
ncbi:L-serine ammonia-lyase, iron-sulfur-dependent, subunit alpha [Mycobacterium sp. ITM-2016-00318]|uniref:L-serine ammonia-lyase, iron-sulfur-dependent, subunit alpha n=1 Tax=Mycobacterium sp. ITM-2016-00318 TaxID=2099693 RepID=UPI000CF8B314|nr:L-serine ammonia-lyase, iron-sulfur-dependent, subunit alpha [Mycobacterium sp. ITM-2016-00318]WNG91749.1 L-serine ammonia-lyase, iron-sulfur-dependent, subunit alpha [Mycobacterium sp. ITM-2016-00318]